MFKYNISIYEYLRLESIIFYKFLVYRSRATNPSSSEFSIGEDRAVER